MTINYSMKTHYNNLLNCFSKEDEKETDVYNLILNLKNRIEWVYSYAKTDEEKQVARGCDKKAISYYQKSLNLNYEKLKQYKVTKKLSYDDLKYIIMTVDKNGNPQLTRIIDVEKGNPILEDGCIMLNIVTKVNKLRANINDLSKWFSKDDTLEELLDKAKKIKLNGSLGSSPTPSTNYEMGNLVGGQLDAQAWENYCVEMGLSHQVNYDSSLDELINLVQECIEFLNKATSIF